MQNDGKQTEEAMIKPGDMTFVSAGNLQGIYRPQVRIYYHNARYGILFHTLTKRLICRSRPRAIKLAKEWAKTPEFAAEANAARARIAECPENTI